MQYQTQHIPRRMIVIGMPGAGKSYLSQKLAQVLDYPVIEKDALSWGANWNQLPDALTAQKIQIELSACPHWIFDGNYGQSSRAVWLQADTVIWLDYPLATIMPALVKRTMARVNSQEHVCNGNIESWDHILGNRSVFRYAIKNYEKCRFLYPNLLRRNEFSHLNLFQFTSPQDTEDWLSELVMRVSYLSPNVLKSGIH